MKSKSFKEYLNSLKANPYTYVLPDNDKKEDLNDEENETKKGQSLLQYLLYANAANQ